MRVERPRAARYPFVTSVTLTNLESGHQSQENTWNLSLYGCQVMPGTFARIGTRVRVQIFRNGDTFEAQGRVTDVRSLMGLGIAFTKVEERHQLVLDKWVAELRNNHKANDGHAKPAREPVKRINP